MSKFVRFLVLLAASLLVTAFFYPLWQIGLSAPQYPETLSLNIWINKVTGDIRTINTLNHYIGMAKVEPTKIPELELFPYLFGFFAGSGLLVVIANRKRLIQLWCAGVLAFACLGLYDFYAWEYRYGHELSEDAPMKLEESYQPPLIGTKQIANITASSWPATAGYGFSVSGLISLLVLGLSFRKKVS